MLNAYEQHSKRKLIATLVSVVVIAGFVIFADHIKTRASSGSTSQTSSTSATTTPSTDSSSSASDPTSTDSTSTATTSSYKDGTYTASSDYYVPHGNESIDVSVTLKDGAVTAVSIQNSEGDRESAQYQEDFTSVYKSYVVGKKISGLQIGIVAGASDTTQGFDDALSQIASQAQA